MFRFPLHANLVYFLQVLLMIFVTYVYTRNIIQFNLLSMIFLQMYPHQVFPLAFSPVMLGMLLSMNFPIIS
jgi:hypothetical protein